MITCKQIEVWVLRMRKIWVWFLNVSLKIWWWMMMMIMMTSFLADKSVIIRIKIIMNFMNEIINPPCNSSLATYFHQFVEHVRRQCDLPRGSEFVPSWHQVSCSRYCFPFPFECPRRECFWRERRGESCGRSGKTGWSRRRVRDWGGYWSWRGGRGWGCRCCWWSGRSWAVWIWIRGIHAVRDPSSQ